MDDMIIGASDLVSEQFPQICSNFPSNNGSSDEPSADAMVGRSTDNSRTKEIERNEIEFKILMMNFILKQNLKDFFRSGVEI